MNLKITLLIGKIQSSAMSAFHFLEGAFIFSKEAPDSSR
jgi:hypothetical protein